MAVKPPSVVNELVDQDRNITYRVMAYRKLSEAEVIMGIRMYVMANKGKLPPKDSTVTILSALGDLPDLFR